MDPRGRRDVPLACFTRRNSSDVHLRINMKRSVCNGKEIALNMMSPASFRKAFFVIALESLKFANAPINDRSRCC